MLPLHGALLASTDVSKLERISNISSRVAIVSLLKPVTDI